jgi:hypothetical protein
MTECGFSVTHVVSIYIYTCIYIYVYINICQCIYLCILCTYVYIYAYMYKLCTFKDIKCLRIYVYYWYNTFLKISLIRVYYWYDIIHNLLMIVIDLVTHYIYIHTYMNRKIYIFIYIYIYIYIYMDIIYNCQILVKLRHPLNYVWMATQLILFIIITIKFFFP